MSCSFSHLSPVSFPICLHLGSCIISPHSFRLCQSCGLCPGVDLFEMLPIFRQLFRSCPPPRSMTAFIAWFPKPLRSLAHIVDATVVVRSSFVPLFDNKIVVRSSSGSGADCFSVPPPVSRIKLETVTFRLLLRRVLLEHFYLRIGKELLFVYVPIEKIFQ